MADEGDDGGPPLGGADELPRGLEAAPEGGDATAQEEEPAAKGAEESGPEETPAEGADISAPEEPLEGIGGVEPEEPPAHSPEALTAEESPEKWAEAVVLEDPSAEEVEHIHPDPPLEEGGASKIDEGTSRGSLGELQNEGEAEAKPEAESPFRDEPPQRHDRELGDPEELQDKAQAAAEEEIAAQEENTPTEVAEADGTEEGADGEAGEAREDDALAKDPVALGDERAGGDEAAAEKGERSLVHDGLEGETSKQLGSLQDCVEAKNGDGPEAEAAKEAEAQAQVTGGERLTSWSAGAMHFDDGTKGDSRQAEDKQEKKKKKKGKKGKKEQKEELPEFPSPSSWDVNFPGAQQQQREGLSNMPQSHEFGPSSPSSSSSSSSSSARVSPPPHHQGVSPWRQPSMPRRPGSAMAALGATSRGPLTRIAAGSGAMAVRGRLAAATSREAVFKQEAEMAGADLDIMREEMAELQAQLDQEAMLRRQMEEELELVGIPRPSSGPSTSA